MHPVITEKTSQLAQNKIFTFQVNINSNKNQIAKTIEGLFGVTVNTVRVITRKGKEKRVGRKMVSKMLPDTKIAYITLKKGTIDLFPQS